MQASVAIVNIGHLGANKFWGETERVRPTSATCTLVTIGGMRVLVDPSPQPDILAPLLRDNAGLAPTDIDLVFITHHHGDHRFGLALFERAPWLMAAGEIALLGQTAPGEASRFVAAEGRLPAGLDLVPTPGHTMAHRSLAVESVFGRVLVAGDAVMTWDHFVAEEGHGNSVDFALAAETIRRMKTDYDLVVPGHGNWFPTGRR